MKDIRLDSPLKGDLVALSEVNDPAFASGAMGVYVAATVKKCSFMWAWIR